MNYRVVTAAAADLQKELDSIEVEFKVRQIFPIVNEPRFLIFAERREAPKVHLDTVDAIGKLLDQGLSPREIARQLHCSGSRVYQVLKQRGITGGAK